MEKFKEPIFVTKPLIPKLSKVEKNLSEVWDAKWFTNDGKQLRLLEEEVTNFLEGSDVVIVTNGTIALSIAINTLELSGEVITTPFTFAATPHALTAAGLKPVFCDVDEKTLNIDPKKIEPLVTDKTTGILAVHVFGQPCDVDEIERIARKYNLKVIYDASHSFGTKINNTPIGCFGHASTFSFHATKLFHSAEGGAVVFNSEKLLKKAMLYRNFGILNEEEVILPGINGKMSEINAAVGRAVLPLVKAEQEKRRILKKRYQEKLSMIPGIKIINSNASVCDSYQYFVIRVSAKEFGLSRDSLYAELKKFNIFSRKYFYPLCSQYPHYKNSDSIRCDLPVAEQVVTEVLVLPYYGGLTPEDVNNICDAIKHIQESH